MRIEECVKARFRHPSVPVCSLLYRLIRHIYIPKPPISHQQCRFMLDEKKKKMVGKTYRARRKALSSLVSTCSDPRLFHSLHLKLFLEAYEQISQ